MIQKLHVQVKSINHFYYTILHYTTLYYYNSILCYAHPMLSFYQLHLTSTYQYVSLSSNFSYFSSIQEYGNSPAPTTTDTAKSSYNSALKHFFLFVIHLHINILMYLWSWFSHDFGGRAIHLLYSFCDIRKSNLVIQSRLDEINKLSYLSHWMFTSNLWSHPFNIHVVTTPISLPKSELVCTLHIPIPRKVTTCTTPHIITIPINIPSLCLLWFMLIGVCFWDSIMFIELNDLLYILGIYRPTNSLGWPTSLFPEKYTV